MLPLLIHIALMNLAQYVLSDSIAPESETYIVWHVSSTSCLNVQNEYAFFPAGHTEWQRRSDSPAVWKELLMTLKNNNNKAGSVC